MIVALIIPAYNEGSRIEKTIRTYHSFFSSSNIQTQLSIIFLIVPNGCTDATISIVQQLMTELSSVVCFPIEQAGKGCAIKEGFLYALTHITCDVIGFVDADGATSPQALYDLFEHLENSDGVIASRYMPGAHISPARPFVKRWGSKLIYEPLVRVALGLSYYDLQCGAKLFKTSVIQKVAPLLTIDQWAFDIELLYLCYKFNVVIKEVPTIWHDQAESKLKIRSGFAMLSAIFDIKEKHKHI